MLYFAIKDLLLKHLRLSIISCLVIFTLILGSAPCFCHAADVNNLEYKLKAAFIYNFIKFTKWPKTTQKQADNNRLVLCVAGKNPFGTALDPLAGKKIAGRQIVLAQASGADNFQNLHDCHVVFIAAEPTSTQFIRALKGRHVLTISDEIGFAEHGGCIELREQNGKIRFIINRTALKQQGLELSYQVYGLALEVIGGQHE